MPLSQFADTVIEHLIPWCGCQLVSQFGAPISSQDGRQQPFSVLAMGKLGGEELNLSSDIDLIFVYERQGRTCGGLRVLTNQQYFTRLGQLLIKILNTQTAEGFVFRVDMRLRPFGQSGPLVISMSGFAQYYTEQGRDWERYAMLKTRVIGQHAHLSHSIHSVIQSFVYRTYIDFSVINGLRLMKRMIASEFDVDQSNRDIKLGRGGIRELEFFVQAIQLTRGGQQPGLRQRNWRCGLVALRDARLIDSEAFFALEKAYLFLRKLEHGLQALKDRQTQMLPTEKFLLNRVVFGMGYQSIEMFLSDLQLHRDHVYAHFQSVVGQSVNDHAFGDDAQWSLGKTIWQSRLDPDMFQGLLSKYQIHEKNRASLQDLVEMNLLKNLIPIVHERLSYFMSIALTLIVKHQYDWITVNYLIHFVEKILRRSTYMVALIEHPFALEQLLRLMDKSVWFAEKIIDQPFLIDELLDRNKIFAPLNKCGLQNDLQDRLLRGCDGDTEFVIDSLRYFQSVHLIKVAASELSGTLPMMRVSDHLTWLAETVLESVICSAWRELSCKYGDPVYDAGAEDTIPFIVVGYGTLGGYELNFSSDLDIVFLYESSPEGKTNGEKSIENNEFYWKLAQKIIHFISVRTKAGALYEVDVRLRPSGNSGLLVSSLLAFEKYQLESAWVWEKQALVRARVVAGKGAPVQKFNEVREAAIMNAGTQAGLDREFVEMRDKMLLSVGPLRASVTDREGYCQKIEKENRFHVKHDPGGMIDIEFLVQYNVLIHAKQYPTLLQYTDNVRLLDELMRVGILDALVAKFLQESYLRLREVQLRATLDCGVDYVANEMWTDLRNRVMELWNETFHVGSGS